MSGTSTPLFGDEWTEKKLEILQRYLAAYTTALKNQPFELIYIDAFAGTGYRELKQNEEGGSLLFPELAEDEPQQLLQGSARMALQVGPPFHRYIFVELAQERARQLSALKEEFPRLASRIRVETSECNSFVRRFCTETDWQRKRAVLFLDPFGMQVEWATLKEVALTRAIDVWILFPHGIGVMRLLSNTGKINEAWSARLDSLFGSHDWYDAFYVQECYPDLQGEVVRRRRKTATFASISQYWIDRLDSIFAGVAENPKELRNSKGNPLYLFCFAASNAKGAKIALRIAGHILDRIG